MWTVRALVLGVAALSISVEILLWLRRRRRAERVLNEVLFFPCEVACVEHILTHSPPKNCTCPLPHGVETPFSRLLVHIMSASSSLDLCMFAFSNAHLSRAVVSLRRKGVTVRVLTDNDYAAIAGSQIGVLRQAGIRVRCHVDSAHMHHKFAVVDGRLLVSGSLNWTLSAVQSNTENVLVTQEADLVRPFVREFQRLWEVNDPARSGRVERRRS